MTNSIKQFFADAIYIPEYGNGIMSIWRRNFRNFRYMFLPTVGWVFVEPIFMLVALGYGLGQFVGEIENLNYTEFISPAILVITGMYVSFFDGTYSTFSKLNKLGTFQTIVLTPLSTDEIVIGEIFWITSKAFLSVLAVSLVQLALGIVSFTQLFRSILVIVIMCWLFASLGFWLATRAKSNEMFSYFQSGFITPMALFFGTYFPIKLLPKYLLYFSYAFPLTHAISAVRMLFRGHFESTFFLNMAYLIFFALLFSNLAAANFRRNLVA